MLWQRKWVSLAPSLPQLLIAYELLGRVQDLLQLLAHRGREVIHHRKAVH